MGQFKSYDVSQKQLTFVEVGDGVGCLDGGFVGLPVVG